MEKEENISNELEVSQTQIENRIYTIRGVQVMLDSDLAEMYEVATKVLNQSVKRNIDRFPERFRFQLNQNETNELVTNCDRFKNLKHSSVMPYVFTESGIAMLSAILRSDIAVAASVRIMDAFIKMRKLISANMGIIQRLGNVEQKQIEMQLSTDQKFDRVFKALENKNVSVCLITKEIKKELKLDIDKFNKQYPTIKAILSGIFHDRFLIIDNKEIYHLGASLKDLGKKLFGFTKMEDGFALLEKIDKICKLEQKCPR